jgi:menaquinone-dependent protoporphyrinogen oxidase
MARRRRAGWLDGMTARISLDDDRLNVPRALVVYASTHGHTAKIAARMARAVEQAHVAVDLRDVADAGDIDPGDYDVVVVGASLHKEHHQPAIAEWVTAHSAGLEARPSVFFSVSLTAADDSDTSRAATQHCIDEFCAQTGWTPGQTETIGGCLQYREYDVFTRQLMRLLMRRMGHPTNASQDYDYTDWAAVDRLGRRIGALAGPAVTA